MNYILLHPFKKTTKKTNSSRKPLKINPLHISMETLKQHNKFSQKD